MLIFRNLLLLVPHLVAKRRCVRDGVLEIVLGVGISVDTDGQNVSGAGPLEAIRAGETQLSILALDVITIEGVSRQTVLSRDDCHVGFQGCRHLAFQHVSAPDFYERTVTEQADIARATTRWVIFVGRLFSYFNLYRRVAF